MDEQWALEQPQFHEQIQLVIYAILLQLIQFIFEHYAGFEHAEFVRGLILLILMRLVLHLSALDVLNLKYKVVN